MTIYYKTTKKDIWSFYLKRWKEQLWKIHIIIFSLSLYLFSNYFSLWSSLFFALAIVGSFFLFPLLLHKREERQLSISKDGISTTIGNRSGTSPWNAVLSINEKRDIIYIINKNQNGFTIPFRAFETLHQKNIFLEQIIEYHKEAME